MIDYSKIVKLSKQGESKNSISNILAVKWDTVDRVLTECLEQWGSLESIPDDITAEAIQARIDGRKKAYDPAYLMPDSETILEVQRKEGKTRNEAWADYTKKAASLGKQAYRPSRFNEIVTSFAASKDISCTITKAPGIEAQVDWVGDKGKLYDADSGKEIPLHLFVMALPYSGYFYTEAFFDEKMPSWLKGHEDAFRFFGGCPARMVPDNCRTAVSQSRRWYFEEVVLNPKYAKFMEHYSVIVCPARVYHPKDKAVVERTVQIIERDLMPSMDMLHLTSLADYNSILRRKLEERLAREYTKRFGSRTSIFLSEEKDELLPLPIAEYRSYVERTAVVGRDFHIQYAKAHYSVPPKHIGEKVTVRDDGTSITISDRLGQKIAQHRKAIREWDWVTDRDHIPENYGANGGYSPEYFLSWAGRFGSETTGWVSFILGHFQSMARAFNTLFTSLHAANKYGKEVVEKASAHALGSRICTSRDYRILLNRYECEATRMKKAAEESIDLNDIFARH